MRAGRFVPSLVAATTFVWSARSSHRRTVSEREAELFRWFNDAPDAIEGPVWAVTQAGSLASVFVATGVAHRRWGPRDAIVVLAVGCGVWAGVKAIKPIVGRGRPDHHLEGVNVRGRPQSGLGYPSGHAAVAMTVAVLSTRSRRSRALAMAAMSLVGCGRMYLGAHLPLDVAGGVAVGVGAGLVTDAVGAWSPFRALPIGSVRAGCRR